MVDRRAGWRSARRPPARRASTRSRRRGTNATTTASSTAAPCTIDCNAPACRAGPRSRTASRVLLEAERPVAEHREIAGRGRATITSRERQQRPGGARDRRPASAGSGEQRREGQRRELRQAGQRRQRAASDRPRRRQHRASTSSADERVVGVGVHHEQRERIRHPQVGEQEPERRAPAAGARGGKSSSAEPRSKTSEAAWAAGRSSQLPLHGQIASNGTYAAYATGPYVSPRGLSGGNVPYSGPPSPCGRRRSRPSSRRR